MERLSLEIHLHSSSCLKGFTRPRHFQGAEDSRSMKRKKWSTQAKTDLWQELGVSPVLSAEDRVAASPLWLGHFMFFGPWEVFAAKLQTCESHPEMSWSFVNLKGHYWHCLGGPPGPDLGTWWLSEPLESAGTWWYKALWGIIMSLTVAILHDSHDLSIFTVCDFLASSGPSSVVAQVTHHWLRICSFLRC